ncbi:MAG: alpha/beta hydrolase [Verrucomicrobiales bacterium]|nr:alpha/beta hydrolase [Verrucomicrobiales bacterium]
MKSPVFSIQPSWVIGLTLFALSLSAQERKQKPANPLPGTAVKRDIHYATHDDVELKLDLYRPQPLPEAPLPVVLWIHGGGWLNGSKDKCRADFLAQKGFAVVSVGYRLTDVARWPGQIDDCSAAVKWVRDHAEAFQLDPDAVGAWGSSAGGHLVALMGTRPTSDDTTIKLQAVCDWFGPTDLLTMPPNVVSETRTYEQVSQSNGAKLLGSPVPEARDLAKDASALYHVSSDDSPFLIMHGSEDPGVPLVQSARFHEALKAAGVDSSFVIIEGAAHGGREFRTEEVKSQVINFFNEHLKP